MNKILLGITLALVVLILGVLGQSVVRQRQARSLVKEINIAVANEKDPVKVASIISVYKDRMEFAMNHRPLLNIDVDFLKSFASDDFDDFLADYTLEEHAEAMDELASDWCNFLFYWMSMGDSVATNIFLASRCAL